MTESLRCSPSIVGALCALLSAPQALGQCQPAWHGSVGDPGIAGFVNALGVFDDGTGPALYVGGSFVDAGGVTVSNLARWDGASWSDVGGGVNPSVLALAVFDDGTGPALYVGGRFTLAGGIPAEGIARWDGTRWSALGGATGTAKRLSHLEYLHFRSYWRYSR